MPSNKKIFDKLVSRVKIYLVIIAVLLTIICISNINLVLPAILFYILVVGYAYWSSEKRKEELSEQDRKSTRLNSSHVAISYAVFCLKKKKKEKQKKK